MQPKKPKASIWKSLRLGLFIIIALVIYAYGFQVTKVDLQEFRKESRQVSRVRVTRALARPDILEYEQREFQVIAPIFVPCTPDQSLLPEPDKTGPYMEVVPSCAKPGSEVRVEGFNFQPHTQGPISFIPSADPYSTLALKRGDIQTDARGHFVVTIKLPDRPNEDIQYLRATTRQNVGFPHFSATAIETWDKIIETVFLALLATTLGVIFSIPISFIAARNLMKDVASPLTSISLSLLGWPVGFLIGLFTANWLGKVVKLFGGIFYLIIGLIICGGVAFLALRWSLKIVDENPPKALKAGRTIAQGFSALLFTLFVYFFANLALVTSGFLKSNLGSFGFLGNFFTQLADITILIIPAITALTVAAVLGSALGRLGYRLDETLPPGSVKIINLIVSVLAGAMLFSIISGVIIWLYEIRQTTWVFGVMAAVGALFGGVLAMRVHPKETVPIGMTIYFATRTILNATRSIEALIMAIVAVIWVGIGPFAGVLALGLHTIASLAKLYSEQVESIMPGPLEAIKATGATRLQTIIYAVVPQIIPPYISFTMYRWDINVRMSTVIGFAGGGGIGFLLIQNINLLNYRAASTQMLAIAIVVSVMDYLSSTMRERFV